MRLYRITAVFLALLTAMAFSVPVFAATGYGPGAQPQVPPFVPARPTGPITGTGRRPPVVTSNRPAAEPAVTDYEDLGVVAPTTPAPEGPPGDGTTPPGYGTTSPGYGTTSPGQGTTSAGSGNVPSISGGFPASPVDIFGNMFIGDNSAVLPAGTSPGGDAASIAGDFGASMAGDFATSVAARVNPQTGISGLYVVAYSAFAIAALSGVLFYLKYWRQLKYEHTYKKFRKRKKRLDVLLDYETS